MRFAGTPSPGYTTETNTSASISAWPVFLACSVASSRLQKRLAAGAPVTEEEIHAALAFLKSLETPLIKQDWHNIKSCLTTEMLSIELSELGMAE